MDKEIGKPHELSLEQRGRLGVSGVEEVESFDEEAVVLNTVGGLLVVRGQNLRLKTLSVDGGKISVEGLIHSLSYEDDKKSSGFLKRLFR